jgi:hypothetical protein
MLTVMKVAMLTVMKVDLGGTGHSPSPPPKCPIAYEIEACPIASNSHQPSGSETARSEENSKGTPRSEIWIAL